MIKVQSLTKSFGQVQVLQGLNMTVQAGQIYGFLGRNGAGKSTTIRILVGILTIGEGSVELFGETMDVRKTSLRQKIGYVAQEQHFYEWMTPKMLGDFVSGFYPKWDKAIYADLLKTMELPDRKVGKFSGGMKAKQALAIALAHNPPLLILDEPTAGLDPVARKEFFRLVREQAQNKGTTVLFSSHLIDEVERAADQVGIIDSGQMHYEGSLGILSQQVRALRGCTEEMTLGQHFQVLQEREDTLVLRCLEPERYQELAELCPNASLHDMSLEDIFIDVVTRKPGRPT